MSKISKEFDPIWDKMNNLQKYAYLRGAAERVNSNYMRILQHVADGYFDETPTRMRLPETKLEILPEEKLKAHKTELVHLKQVVDLLLDEIDSVPKRIWK